jgi:Uma2 family endonuclease
MTQDWCFVERVGTMTIAKSKPMTLEEYLNYDDGTDARYELVDGILVEMGAESSLNVMIESFLLSIFFQLLPYYCVHRGTEIVVEGIHANTRIPDLVVITEEGVTALRGKNRSMITLDMPAPTLVVEVVSNSEVDRQSHERDYIHKRTEYAQRGIVEYWIVDPIADIVLVLNLAGQTYQEQRFVKDEKLISLTFPTLALSAKQVLTAGL